MSITSAVAKRLCTKTELALFTESLTRNIKSLDAKALRSRVVRSRRMRDKYRQLADRQEREAQGKTVSSETPALPRQQGHSDEGAIVQRVAHSVRAATSQDRESRVDSDSQAAGPCRHTQESSPLGFVAKKGEEAPQGNQEKEGSSGQEACDWQGSARQEDRQGGSEEGCKKEVADGCSSQTVQESAACHCQSKKGDGTGQGRTNGGFRCRAKATPSVGGEPSKTVAS